MYKSVLSLVSNSSSSLSSSDKVKADNSEAFKHTCRWYHLMCYRLKGGKETDKDVTVVDSDDGDISSKE